MPPPLGRACVGWLASLHALEAQVAVHCRVNGQLQLGGSYRAQLDALRYSLDAAAAAAAAFAADFANKLPAGPELKKFEK